MPDTLSSLLVVLVALLPGGVHTWAFERATGKSEQQVSDRIPRLLTASALYLVLAIPAIPIFRMIARSATAGTITTWWRYGIAIGLLIGLPWLIGTGMGRLTKRRHQKGVRGWIGRRIAGVAHATRAWDHLFGVQGLTGTIRVILTDETHLIGSWGKRPGGGRSGDPPTISYASGYPNPQRDLYIAELKRLEFPGNTPGQDAGGGAAWVPGESIKYIEFYPDERRSN